MIGTCRDDLGQFQFFAVGDSSSSCSPPAGLPSILEQSLLVLSYRVRYLLQKMRLGMISVVVPVYNTGPYLERVISALRAQDMRDDDYELIFVDNGSTDDSLATLQRHDDIRLLQEKKRGSYAARNRGVREARGDIIVFTDSDCFPVPGWLTSIQAHFDSQSQAQVAMGPRIPPRNRRSLRLVSDYENQKAVMIFRSEDPQVYYGYTNNMAVRREAMETIGPFVERGRGSDTIFIRRLVDTHGCEAVTHCDGMAVEHAELDSIRVYYSKIMIYSRSRKSYRHVETVRPLSRDERLAVFRETVRNSPVVDSVYLFLLLAGGALAWWWAGLRVSQSDA
jgi:glycosyltransferase involved in cell wall biosynthesis